MAVDSRTSTASTSARRQNTTTTVESLAFTSLATQSNPTTSPQCQAIFLNITSKLLILAVVLSWSASVAIAIPPAFIDQRGNFIDRSFIAGQVSHIDQNARTFRVSWLSRAYRHHSRQSFEATVITTAKTTYVAGSWSDLKNRLHVKLLFHLEGDTIVADNIRIWALSPW